MNIQNNKESINLLELLSESNSEGSDLTITPRKKRVKRKYRTNSAVKTRHGEFYSSTRSQITVISLWLAVILITFWVVSLTWLTVTLYGEIGRMDFSIKSVIAGREGVADDLQKCHSLSRDLQKNQKLIFSNVTDLKLQITNFTMQLSAIQHGLHQVQDWLQAAPELVNVPKDLNALSNSVVSFGSQIRDLGATINILKESNAKLQITQNIIAQNITYIEHLLLQLSNITQTPQMSITNKTRSKTEKLNAAVSHSTSNIKRVNETLTNSLQRTIDD